MKNTENPIQREQSKIRKSKKNHNVEINILNIFNSLSKHRYEKKAEILFKNNN